MRILRTSSWGFRGRVQARGPCRVERQRHVMVAFRRMRRAMPGAPRLLQDGITRAKEVSRRQDSVKDTGARFTQPVVAKHGSVFLLTADDGDIRSGSDQGLYFHDMRYISAETLRFDG